MNTYWVSCWKSFLDVCYQWFYTQPGKKKRFICDYEGVIIHAKWAILSHIMARTNIISMRYYVQFVNDQNADFAFYSANSMKQYSAGKNVSLRWHMTLCSLLLNAVCLAERHQRSVLLSLVWHNQGLIPWSTILQASMLILYMYHVIPPLLFFRML